MIEIKISATIKKIFFFFLITEHACSSPNFEIFIFYFEKENDLIISLELRHMLYYLQD